MHGASLHRRHRFRGLKDVLWPQHSVRPAKAAALSRGAEHSTTPGHPPACESGVAPRLAARIDSLRSPFGQPAAVYLPAAVFDPLRSGSKTLRARLGAGASCCALLLPPAWRRLSVRSPPALKTSLCQPDHSGVILALLMGNRPDIHLIIRISFGLIRA